MEQFPFTSEGRTHGLDPASQELDVFKILQDGDVLWCGSFSNPQAAKARIDALLVSDPSEYFIHSHPTGQRLFFKPNGHNGAR